MNKAVTYEVNFRGKDSVSVVAKHIAAESASMQRSVASAATASNQALSSVNSTIGHVASGVVAAFGVAQIKRFAQSIVDVRGDIQALEISFSTLLGSAKQAKRMMSELRDFAINTPMQLDTLAGGAQTLLGFNVAAEKVMPILRQIGDISMGDAQKFNSLVLAFAQMSSTGKLMGQDLLQMINAGFNPLTVMAEQTGKSIAQLKQEMSDGAISSDMVAYAFAAATTEGGKFHGMLNQISKGINGAKSNLQGAWDDMLNEIGAKNESFIVGAINKTTILIKNYEKVGRAITALVATYGTYKAALIACAVAQKTALVAKQTVEYIKMAKALGVATANQIAFNTVTKLNPYVALASVLAALVGAVVLYTTKTEEATEAQKALANVHDTVSKTYNNEASKIDRLQNVYRNNKVSIDERRKALEELQAIVPEYAASLTTEGKLINDNTDAIKEYLAQFEKKIRLQAAQEELEAAYRRKRELERQKVAKEKELSDAERYNSTVAKPMVQSKISTSGMQAISMGAGSGTAKPTAGLKASIKEIDQDLSDINNTISELNGEIETSSIVTQKVETQTKSYSQQVTDAAAKVRRLSTELAALRKGNGDSSNFAADIEAKQKEYDAAVKVYKTLTGTDVGGLNIEAKVGSIAELDATISKLDEKLKKASAEERAAIQQTITEYKKQKETIEESLAALSVPFSPTTLEELSVAISYYENKLKKASAEERDEIQQTILQYRKKEESINDSLSALGISENPQTLDELSEAISFYEKRLGKASESERADIQRTINAYKRKQETIHATLAELDIPADPASLAEFDQVLSALETKLQQAGEAERDEIQKSINAYRQKKQAVEDSLSNISLAEMFPDIDLNNDIIISLRTRLEGAEIAKRKINELRQMSMVAQTDEEKESIAKSIKQWQAYAGSLDNTRKSGDNAIGVIGNIGSIMNSLSGIVGEGAAGWLTYGANVLSAVAAALPALAQVIGGNIAEAFSGAAAQSQTVPFPFNLIALAASMAAVGAAVASIPKFADGGIAYGPTVGLFGEYSGAANNPEVVAPLDRLRSLIEPSSGVGEVTFRIEGRTLVGVLNKTNRQRNRTR